MHPSAAAGSGDSGPFSSMNPPNQIAQHTQSSSHLDSTTAPSSSLWYFADKPLPAPSASTPMIGPPSTFYNPEDNSQQLRDSHAQQYQQWIEMFGNQQRGATTAYDALQQQQHHQHRGYQPMPQTQFNFVAGQYTPPHSLSAYAESASGGTVTQSNVGAPSDDYDNSREGYQPYYDLLAATAGASSSSVSPQSYHPRAMSESTYTETPSSAYQQPTHSHPHSLQTNPQQRSSAQTQHQQQTQPQRPTQPAPSHARQQHLSPHHQAYSSGSNTLSTHSASLSPASVSWTDDASYPNAHPSPPSVNGRGTYAQPQPQHPQRQNGALNGNGAAGRSTHIRRPVGTAELSPGSSPPGTNGINGTSHQPQKQTHSHHLLVGPPLPPAAQAPKANGTGTGIVTKTGSKRKRVKRGVGEESSSPPQNQHRPHPQQQNGNGNGQLKIVPWTEFAGEPGSDSDSDDSDDEGFFDGGDRKSVV